MYYFFIMQWLGDNKHEVKIYTLKEMESSVNSVNAFHHQFQSLLFSRLMSKM
jgi:hypothetical protein